MDGFTPANSTARDTARACDDEVCITCSDTAVASRVVELRQLGLALVDTGSSLEEVSVALVDARPGDTVLVHGGEAIAVVAGT